MMAHRIKPVLSSKYSGMYGLSERVQIKNLPERKGFAACAWISINALKTQLRDNQAQQVILLMKGEHRFSHDRALEKVG